jgi:hypothetical protein
MASDSQFASIICGEQQLSLVMFARSVRLKQFGRLITREVWRLHSSFRAFCDLRLERF